jgi:hypothetical protein
MSLQRVKAALSTAEYAPHTLTLGSEFDFKALSPAAQAFFISSFPEGIGLPDLLSPAPWDADVQSRYRALETEERMEVLALAGFYNHELVHRIDFLTTPFGVSFHGKACLESIGLLLDSAELVAALEQKEPNRPLRDIPALSEKMVVSRGIDTLNARIRWFDSLRGASPKHLKPGWMDDPASLNLAYQDLELAMVHELVATVAIPGIEGAYFRPLTILESRAVSLTSLLLLSRLGGDRAAADDVVLFLETFYSPRESFPDYRFLLDLVVGLWGADDFPALLDEHGVKSLQSLLRGMAMLGWYALHATPETNAEGMANSSPMLRFIAALQELHGRVRDGDNEFDAVEFLDSVDTSKRGKAFGFSGSRETLGYSLRYLHRLRRHNYDANPHAGLKAHFETVLSIQQRQLERRFSSGYDFPSGMPESGSAITGLGSEPDDAHLLFGEEDEPSAEVFDWFRLREMLLFRHARPPGFWADVWRALGTHPGIEESDPEAARELALDRARFVTEGTWPTGGGIETDDDGTQLVLIPVRTSTLPETYRAAVAEEELSVETSWQVLHTAAEPLVALDVSFPEKGEKARLLFSPALHRAAIEAIVRFGLMALLSDEAAHAFEGGKPHPATVCIPVTAASELLASVLEGEAEIELSEVEGGWLATYSRGGEQLHTISIEAYEWPAIDDLDRAVRAIEAAELGPVTITLNGLPHPADGELRVLAAAGSDGSLESLRELLLRDGRPSGHPLSREMAEKLFFDFQKRVVEEALESGRLPYQRGELKPLPVDLGGDGPATDD